MVFVKCGCKTAIISIFSHNLHIKHVILGICVMDIVRSCGQFSAEQWTLMDNFQFEYAYRPGLA